MKMKIDFKNPEDFRRLEQLTYDGTLDYSDFLPPEYKYFSELRKIYHAFKFEGLSQELAERQKKALLIEYQRYLETFENARKTYADWQGNIKVAEMLMTKIQKSHDINEIASTAIQIIGKLTHDDVFINTNLKKLEVCK